MGTAYQVIIQHHPTTWLLTSFVHENIQERSPFSILVAQDCCQDPVTMISALRTTKYPVCLTAAIQQQVVNSTVCYQEVFRRTTST